MVKKLLILTYIMIGVVVGHSQVEVVRLEPGKHELNLDGTFFLITQPRMLFYDNLHHTILDSTITKGCDEIITAYEAFKKENASTMLQLQAVYQDNVAISNTSQAAHKETLLIMQTAQEKLNKDIVDLQTKLEDYRKAEKQNLQSKFLKRSKNMTIAFGLGVIVGGGIILLNKN